MDSVKYVSVLNLAKELDAWRQVHTFVEPFPTTAFLLERAHNRTISTVGVPIVCTQYSKHHTHTHTPLLVDQPKAIVPCHRRYD